MNFLNYHNHSKIKEKASGIEWCLTGFYGIPETSMRSDSWALLDRINQTDISVGV